MRKRGPMKIVVVGDDNLVGTKLVTELRRQGHSVVVTAPPSDGDAASGESVAGAVRGAQVAIDLANSLPFEGKEIAEFSETSFRNLLVTEAAAGVGHHLALSVVGTERHLKSGYVRAKMTQETLIRGSKIPYTILRSAQFFESISSIIQFGAEGDVVSLPPAFVQPIASDDVAFALANLAVGVPANSTIEVTGPQLYRLDALAREVMAANKDGRQVVEDAHTSYFESRSDDSPLPPGDHRRFAPTRFEDWLGRSLA